LLFGGIASPACIADYLVLDVSDKNSPKIPRKVLKGIDKTNIQFIIGLWGKVGKRGGCPHHE
jgi:hypothetical protein